MNVLADRHHAGLFHSLELMARRFGWTLYTPTGRDWFDEWYWSFGRVAYGDDRLAVQFLECPLERDNEYPDSPIRFVTLQEARQMDWAFVIATVQDNQSGFAKFAREMGAQYVLQVGNTRQDVDWSLDPLALVSSEVPILGRGIRYHQEVDPVAFREPVDTRTAASFVNCMSSMGRCWDIMPPEVDIYGIDGARGILKPHSRLIDTMASYGWGWHDKAQGDGFGHVIHDWAQVGRPLIGHASHYAGLMAEPFWQDGVTCIDLDRHSVADAWDIVQTITPARHLEMCLAIRAEFDRIDYDAEAERIADFLGLRVPA